MWDYFTNKSNIRYKYRLILQKMKNICYTHLLPMKNVPNIITISSDPLPAIVGLSLCQWLRKYFLIPCAIIIILLISILAIVMDSFVIINFFFWINKFRNNSRLVLQGIFFLINICCNFLISFLILSRKPI